MYLLCAGYLLGLGDWHQDRAFWILFHEVVWDAVRLKDVLSENTVEIAFK